MRTLKFIIDGEIIKPDPTCDFSGLVPGAEKRVRAEFAFSPEWQDAVKVAAFYSRLGEEYPAQFLLRGKSCVIPEKALAKRIFKIKIAGKKPDGSRLLTNKVEVDQNGGKT